MPNYKDTRRRPTTGNVVRNRQESSGALPGNARKQEAPAIRPVGPQTPERDARNRTVNRETPGANPG